MRSLQRRVIIGGLVWAALATLIGALALSTVFDQIADRRFDQLLSARHTQAVIALGNSQVPENVDTFLTDPEYTRPYSGRYWQITGEDGIAITSPSLFDALLPIGITENQQASFWETEGPDGRLRGYSELISLQNGSRWIVSVAESLNALEAERVEMRRSVAVAFGLVGLLGIAAAGLLTSVLVSPLRKLSDDVVHRWDSGKELSPEDYPLEVAPLVDDINELLARNHEILDRGRRQAADLAHALKTPSAALRNELLTMSEKVEGTAPLFEALDRIDAQIMRSLARMRAATAAGAVNVGTDVGQSVARIERLFRVLPEAREKSFEVESVSASVAMDAQDLEETLGNLLENAFKWCKERVALRVGEVDGKVQILIEDDGPGIPLANRQAALREGARLDTSVPGTGLGLSICLDLVSAYGGTMELDQSRELGGLAIRIRLPKGIASKSRVITRTL